MPTYNPDGTIELDSTNRIGVGANGGSGPFRADWFRDNYSTLDGLAADRDYDHYEPGFRYGWESAGTRAPWLAVCRGAELLSPRLARRHATAPNDTRVGPPRVQRAMHVFEGAKTRTSGRTSPSRQANAPIDHTAREPRGSFGSDRYRTIA